MDELPETNSEETHLIEFNVTKNYYEEVIFKEEKCAYLK